MEWKQSWFERQDQAPAMSRRSELPLERRLASLLRKVDRLSAPQNGGIELRRLTKDQARAEIIDLFQSGETLYYSDIVQRLGIDIEDVIEICRELETEDRNAWRRCETKVTAWRANECT